MSLTHVKSAIAGSVSAYQYTFYLFKAEQYTFGRVQNVGCVYYCHVAACYTRKSRLAVVDLD